MKTLFKTLGVLGLFFFLLSNVGWGQTTYYSQATGDPLIGDPTLYTSWNTEPDGSGTTPTDASVFTAGNIFIIQGGQDMITSATWSVSGTGSVLEIQDGGILESPFAITLSTSTTFQIDANGTYKHQNTDNYATTILNGIETFDAASNFEINNSNPTGPVNVTGGYGNLIINLTMDPGDNINCYSNITSINGNLEILSGDFGDAYEFRLSNNNGLTLNIGGNLNIFGGILVFSNGTNESVEYVLDLSGNFNQTGGSFQHNNTANGSTLTLNMNGTGKSISNVVSGTSGSGFLNINWVIKNPCTINTDFLLPQSRSLTLSGGNLSVASTKTLKISGNLDCKSYIVNGTSGKFTLNATGTLITAHSQGVSTTANTGCVQVTGTKTFNLEGSYEYNGTSAQVTGNGINGTTTPGKCKNLTINNTAGVTMSKNITISGVFTMTNGSFSKNSFTLAYGVDATLKYNNQTTEQTTADSEFPSSGGPVHFMASNPIGLKLNGTKTITGLITISSNSILDMESNVLNAGSYQINGTLKTSNVNGINGSLNVSSSKGYSVSSNYVFYGTSEGMITGSTTLGTCNNITVNNTNGVSLGNSLIINGYLDLSAGTFILNSKTVTLNGTIVYDYLTGNGAGTISSTNTASISIGGTGALGTLKFTNGSNTLGAFTINRTTNGGVTLGSALTIDNNTLTLTEGVFDISGQALTFTNGNIPIAKTNGTITTSTSSSLVFGTNGNQGGSAFTIPSGTFGTEPTINNFSVNRTNNLTLTQPINVNGTLTLTSGLLIGNGNLITLGSGSGNIGTLSRTDGIIVGTFKRWLSSATSNYIFPLGTTSPKYNGIELQYDGSGVTAPGTLTATFTIGDPGNNNNPNSVDDAGYNIDKYSNFGYWTITNSNVTGNYNINLNTNGFPGISSTCACREKLRILKRANSGSNWSALGTHVTATGADQTCMVAKRSGLDSFSDFAIGSNVADNPFDGPLPVSLSSFNSTLSSRDVNLKWVTTSEINNAGFDVERKTIEGTWAKVGYVKGNGTVNSSSTYNFTDRKLNAGKFNYRLKQVDNNGNFEYHNLGTTIEVSVPKEYQLSQNYPNPFNPITKIDFSLPFDSKVNLIIYDLTGREVKTLVNESRQAGYHTVDLNASMLSSGTYFFRIIANANGKDFISTKKMVLVK